MIRALSLLLLLTACTSQKRWVFREVDSVQFDSVQLQYIPERALVGVGIEFLKGPFGTLGYLQVTVRRISSAQVVIEIGGDKFRYEAERMEGGQRLLLPDEATEKILACLQANQPLTLYLEGYMAQLDPAHYSKNIKKFLSAEEISKLY